MKRSLAGLAGGRLSAYAAVLTQREAVSQASAGAFPVSVPGSLSGGATSPVNVRKEALLADLDAQLAEREAELAADPYHITFED